MFAHNHYSALLRFSQKLLVEEFIQLHDNN